MEIIGTDRDIFKMLLSETFDKGDIFNTGNNVSVEVVKRDISVPITFEYTVTYPALIGDELDYALRNWKIIERYLR